MHYGTETIPKVDKIQARETLLLREAKKVFGLVDIDMIAGPSEILVISDGNSDCKTVAADMLFRRSMISLQALYLVTDSRNLAEGVAAEIERQLKPCRGKK